MSATSREPSDSGDNQVADAQAALRWLDAFPWIEAVALAVRGMQGDADLWWLEPVDPSGTTSRAHRLADIADLAFESLTSWTIGQIFPGLPTGTVLARLPMTNRAKNALTRLGYFTAGDIQSLGLAELLDAPQVGVGTVDSILQALADASTLEPTPPPPMRVSAQTESSQGDHRVELTESWVSLMGDLRAVAEWCVALGLPSLSLMGEQLPPASPAEVIKARQRLEMITAGDLLGPAPAELDAAEMMQSFLAMLEERARLILAMRLFADVPVTLDELGQHLGVTRERVRQIEGRARANAAEEFEPGKPLGDVAAAVRELVGVVLPLADLLTLMPALAHPVEAAEQPAWRVLDRLDDSFEIKDGWCAAPTVLSAQNETMTRVQEVANRHGVARLSDLGPLNPNQPEASSAASRTAWLRYCNCLVDGDHILSRFQSVGDRAAAILSVAGTPMSSEEILARFDVERSLSSLKNVMGSDDRFTRVDRDKWALAEWGLESYSGIKAVIRDEIGREGGRISMDALIERITGRYTVSANSVITYANAPPFEARDGVVRLAAGTRDIRKSPERTRRLYRRPDSWLYRITVTKEHLRGSGFTAPVAIAAITGIQPGQSRQLDSAHGEQTINWNGSQPAFGSILRFLVDGDIETGSEIFLVLGDDGSFQIEPVDTGESDPLERAILLTGSAGAAAHQQPRAALATAIGLPEDSPVASLIGGYRDRGDGDIAELLLAARDQLEAPSHARAASSPDIDEILDLL